MTERKQKIFLHKYEETLNIKLSCEKAGISRTTFYRWKAESDSFNIAYENAKRILNDEIESVLFIALKEKEDGIPTKQAVTVALQLHKSLNNKIDSEDTVERNIERICNDGKGLKDDDLSYQKYLKDNDVIEKREDKIREESDRLHIEKIDRIRNESRAMNMYKR